MAPVAFQFVLSTIALASTGGSLAIWLILVADTKITPMIICQAIIRAILFVGLIVSIILTLYCPVYKSGNGPTYILLIK
jgi:hypothetical protein